MLDAAHGGDGEVDRLAAALGEAAERLVGDGRQVGVAEVPAREAEQDRARGEAATRSVALHQALAFEGPDESGGIGAPVWPTWSECGLQPRLVTTREPPTAPPSSSASSSRAANPSALPTPRPPPTTTRASASETAPDAGAIREVTRTRTSS